MSGSTAKLLWRFAKAMTPGEEEHIQARRQILYKSFKRSWHRSTAAERTQTGREIREMLGEA